MTLTMLLLSASNLLFLICGIYVGIKLGNANVPFKLPSVTNHDEEAVVPTEQDESGDKYV